MPNKPVRKKRNGLHIFWTILGFLGLFLGFLLLSSAKWYTSVYGKLGFDAVLYTLTNLQGAASGLISEYIKSALVPALIVTVFVFLLIYLTPAKQLTVTFFKKLRVKIYPFHGAFRCAFTLLLMVSLICGAAAEAELPAYIQGLKHSAAIYDSYYVDPNTARITFPEQKRNLIYIFLESMETTFLSQEHQGALPYDTIPELYDLASENVNFSQNEDVGGFSSPPGTNWTVGAMVAQSAGIPLKTPPGLDGNGYGLDGVFLPGATTITNILHDAGYYQALMFGSESEFGGRRALYEAHGLDAVYDYNTAKTDGLIDDDYYVWWGFEDDKLFDYAKQKLSELAAMDQPFAFTTLTADTHHIDGYLCPDCPDLYEEQYENVLACSSRKVAEFVEWIQQQDFYENTTIVICGDHPTMDNGYISRNVDPSYKRKVYNCIINPAIPAQNEKNRQFCTFDMFPTTLTAMGCQIEGERLGLGTNLFSDVPTLAEECGMDYVNYQFSCKSPFYNKNFLGLNF